MTTTHSEPDDRARRWLIGALEETARWRSTKADEYPDDPRNARAASALEGAAEYVRRAVSSPAVALLTTFLRACDKAGFYLGHTEEAPLPGDESQHVASRYFFDNLPGEANAASHEQLLRDLFEASLRDMRTFIGERPDGLGGEGSVLRELIERHIGGKAAERDPVVELLTEIRDLLRERLPAS